MLRQQRRTIHRPSEKHILTECLLWQKAASVVMLDATTKAMISSVENNIARIGGHARPLKDCFKRRTGPVGGTDGLVMPGLTSASAA